MLNRRKKIKALKFSNLVLSGLDLYNSIVFTKGDMTKHQHTVNKITTLGTVLVNTLSIVYLEEQERKEQFEINTQRAKGLYLDPEPVTKGSIIKKGHSEKKLAKQLEKMTKDLDTDIQEYIKKVQSQSSK